jgi:kynureninase
VRFLTGTPNPAAHYAGTAGYDLVEEIGVDRIRESSLRQTQLLIDLADAAGFEVTSAREPDRRGGTVVLRVREFAAVHAELEARAVLCDFRPDAGIRLGPHYFTTDDELRFAVEQITDILDTLAYERHLGAVARH